MAARHSSARPANCQPAMPGGHALDPGSRAPPAWQQDRQSDRMPPTERQDLAMFRMEGRCLARQRTSEARPHGWNRGTRDFACRQSPRPTKPPPAMPGLAARGHPAETRGRLAPEPAMVNGSHPWSAQQSDRHILFPPGTWFRRRRPSRSLQVVWAAASPIGPCQSPLQGAQHDCRGC